MTPRSSILVFAVLALLGCDDEPGQRFDCVCEFLTDTDDTSQQKLSLCEKSQARADQAAMGCAQSGAPASVQGCRCAPAPNKSPCKAGDCTVAAHR